MPTTPEVMTRRARPSTSAPSQGIVQGYSQLVTRAIRAAGLRLPEPTIGTPPAAPSSPSDVSEPAPDDTPRRTPDVPAPRAADRPEPMPT
jgi:hypothetical protein